MTGGILGEIADERERQDMKWGEQNHPDADPVILGRLADGSKSGYGSPEAVARRLAEHYEMPTAARAKFLCDFEEFPCGRTWIGIALEELAEILEATTEGRGRVRAEVIQLAAVLVAWLEDIERNG